MASDFTILSIDSCPPTSRCEAGSIELNPDSRPANFEEAVQEVQNIWKVKTAKLLETNNPLSDLRVVTSHRLAFGTSPGGRLTIVYLDRWTSVVRKVAHSLDKWVVSNDGEYLFVKTSGNSLLAFGLPDLTLLNQIECVLNCDALQWGPPRLLYLVCLEQREVQRFAWDTSELAFRQVVGISLEHEISCVLSNDCRVRMHCNETTVRFFASSEQLLGQIECENGFDVCAFSPNSTLFAFYKLQRNLVGARHKVVILRMNQFTEFLRIPLPETPEFAEPIIHALAITEDDHFLLAALSGGYIQIWDMTTPDRSVTTSVQLPSIGSFCLDPDTRTIYSCSSDGFLLSKTPFPFFSEPEGLRLESTLTCAAAIRGNNLALDCDGKSWIIRLNHNLRTVQWVSQFNAVFAILENQDTYFVSAALDHRPCLCLCDENLQHIATVAQLAYPASCLTAANNVLFYGDQSGRVGSYSMTDDSLCEEIAAHDSDITCIHATTSRQLLVIGLSSGFTFIYDVKEFALQLTVKQRASIQMLAASNDEELLCSASQDGSIHLISLVYYHVVTTFVSGGSGVNSARIIGKSKYLYSMNDESNLQLWCLTTFSLIYSQKHQGYNRFLITENEEKFVFLGPGQVKCIPNPLKHPKVSVVGVPSEVEFEIYILSLIASGGQLAPRPDLDAGVILPFLITPIHLYTYFSFYNCLKTSMMQYSPLLLTSFGDSPFALSLFDRTDECLNILILGLKHRVQLNPQVLSCLDAATLIEINRASSLHLHKLYKYMLIQYSDNGKPIWIKRDVKLPKTCFSLHHPRGLEMIDPADSGQRAIAWNSSVSLPVIFESRLGKEFLLSLKAIRNPKVFSTRIIQYYLKHHLRFSMLSQLSLMLSFLYFWGTLIFLAFASYYVDDTEHPTHSKYIVYYTVIAIVHSLLLVISFGVEIFKNALVVIQLLLLAVTFGSMFENDVTLYSIYYGIVLLLGVLRGIGLCQCIPTLKHIPGLLVAIFRDSWGLICILSFASINFSLFVLYATEDDNFSLFMQFFAESLVRLVLGKSEDENDDARIALGSLGAIFGTLLVPIITLNLLISIIGDTHDKMQLNREVAAGRAELSILFEVYPLARLQSIFVNLLKVFIGRERDVSDGFMLILDKKGREYTDRRWRGRVREIKRDIEQVQRRVNRIEKSLKPHLPRMETSSSFDRSN